MQLKEGPQLPLTTGRKALLAAGIALFGGQVAAAVTVAPATTGTGDAHAGTLLMLWACSIVMSVVTVLLIIRHADLADVATASMLVTISAYAAFALTAAFHLRGSDDAVNLTDALFLGVTGGALTAMLVWGAAMAVARLLRLPTSAGVPGDR